MSGLPVEAGVITMDAWFLCDKRGRSMRVSAAVRFLIPAVLLLFMAGCSGGGGGDTTELLAPDAGLDPLEPTVSRDVIDELGGAMPPAEMLGEVVATVNGEPILARKVFELAQMNLTRMRSLGAEIDEGREMELRRIVLNLVIASELLVQEAKKEGLEVPVERVDDALAQLRNQYGGQETFTRYMEKVGIDEAALRQESERLLLAEIYRERLGNEVEITEELLRNYYNENPGAFVEGEEVHGAFILIKSGKNDPEAKRADARSRIEQAKAAIDGGMSFEETARTYSQADNAAKGGDLGFFGRGDMVPAFENAAFALKPGEVSEIFETPFGLNLVQCIERKEPEQRTFEQVKPELMLDVAKREKDARVAAKISELMSAAAIEIVNQELLDYQAPVEPDEEEAVAPVVAEED
jgi:peptidyl-prolyl cis-trans isomerase C